MSLTIEVWNALRTHVSNLATEFQPRCSQYGKIHLLFASHWRILALSLPIHPSCCLQFPFWSSHLQLFLWEKVFQQIQFKFNRVWVTEVSQLGQKTFKVDLWFLYLKKHQVAFSHHFSALKSIKFQNTAFFLDVIQILIDYVLTWPGKGSFKLSKYSFRIEFQK